jgi:hypothetical protein
MIRDYKKPGVKNYTALEILDNISPCNNQYTNTFYTTTGNVTVNADGNVYSSGTVVTNEHIWVEYTLLNPSFGILGFDVSSLAGKTIASAKLRVYLTQYTDTLNIVTVDHINFGSSIDASDYSGGTLAGNIGTISSTSIIEWKELDVTSYVQADLTAGRTSSQYRFMFNGVLGTSLALFEDAENTGGTGNKPQLVVTYY